MRELIEGEVFTSREGDVRTVSHIQRGMTLSKGPNASHKVTYLVKESPEHYVHDIDGTVCRYRNSEKWKAWAATMPKSNLTVEEILQQLGSEITIIPLGDAK